MNKKLNIFILGIVLVVFICNSCSKDLQYKTLTFFFDGVPDTAIAFIQKDSLKIKVDSGNVQNNGLNVLLSDKTIHQPYKEHQCDACHQTGSLVMPQPGLCYQCHEDFAAKFTFLHGPVSGGYCTECHHPHQGERKLLKRKGQELCFYCHEKEQVFANEVHAEIGETMCTECHNPHGGTDKFLFN